MRLFLFLFTVLLAVHLSSAQTFKGVASIPAIETDGFYRIIVPPILDPYVNVDFSNVRIFDPLQKEVPYLVQKESPLQYSKTFRTYEILENRKEKKHTTLVFKNGDSRPINNIYLSIKNAEVTTVAKLLGSDDRKNWFALKEHFVWMPANNPDGVTEIRIIDFPLSNYAYYQLQIDCRTSAPINILKAGYYEVNTEAGRYTEILPLQITLVDSVKKHTGIKIRLDSTRIIDKLVVSMAGTPYFLRESILYTRERFKNSKGKAESRYTVSSDFEMSSKQASVIELDGDKVEEFLVMINNNDNPPLNVSSIKVYQLNRYCVAWLQKDKHYTLKIGDGTLQTPVYDLDFFKDSIPATPVTLTPGKMMLVGSTLKPKESATFFTSQSIIWIALILVIVALGFMTVRMIRDLK